MSSQIDETKPVTGMPTTDSVRSNFSIAKTEISNLQTVTAGGPFLATGGGRMSGPMYLYNDPTDGRMPATKDYVDAHGGGGGGGIPEAPADANTYGRHAGAWVAAVPLAGSTMTGPLILSADPAPGAALGATTKQYVDAISVTATGAVQRAGDTMSGLLTLSGPPTAGLHASTKTYVDNAVSPLAPLASPVFSGSPTAPTAAQGSATAQLATCGFVANALGGYLLTAGGTVTGNLTVNGTSSLGTVNTGSFTANGSVTANGAGGISFIANSGAGVDNFIQYSVIGQRQWRAGIIGSNLAYLIFDTSANAARLQIATDGTCLCTTGTWGSLSDRRLKRNISAYTTGLDAIRQLEPVTFKYNEIAGSTNDNWQYGLVAQDVEKIMPELVGETDLRGDSSDPEMRVKTVDPGRAIYAILNALKEIDLRLAALEGKEGKPNAPN
jgi:hypothetical protein